MPATVQIELFKQGIISPVDVVRAQIEQFKRTNTKVNAATFTHFDTALLAAKESEERYRNGTYRPLEGITVGIKDEHYDAGWVVTQGSLVHKNDPPQAKADPIVAKLKAAGAIPMIQTTVPEFYVHFCTTTRAWGTTRNPWNLNFSVGGSSGGSGAALAAGYVTLATGSDMGGSIRIPAAFNGLYGYKTVPGEVHSDIPLSHFSGTGPLARTFEDMVLMRNVIAGPSEVSVSVGPASELPLHFGPIAGMRIAYVGGMGIFEPSKETQTAMEQAIGVLRAQGAVVEEVKLDLMTPEQEFETYSSLTMSGPLGGSFASYADKLDQLTPYGAFVVKKSLEQGRGNKQLFEGEQAIKALYAKISEAVFQKGYAVMLAPTLPTSHIPAAFDYTKDALVEDGVKYPMFAGGIYTLPFNMLNWMPVVNVPAGLSGKHMPIGMQVIGRPGDTATVFAVAYNYSKGDPGFFRKNLLPEVH